MPIVINRISRVQALLCISVLIFGTLILAESPGYGVSYETTNKPSVFKTGNVDTTAENDFLNKTNNLRASKGLPPLNTNNELLAKARAWSQKQADAGSIFHSNLASGVTQNWKKLGENVGTGPDVSPIHDALVQSPRHYENLVDSDFTEVGIGVIRQGDVIYVTQVFIQFMPGSSEQNSIKVQGKKATPAQSASQSSAPIVQAAPLKTASPELNATVKKISALEA